MDVPPITPWPYPFTAHGPISPASTCIALLAGFVWPQILPCCPSRINVPLKISQANTSRSRCLNTLVSLSIDVITQRHRFCICSQSSPGELSSSNHSDNVLHKHTLCHLPSLPCLTSPRLYQYVPGSTSLKSFPQGMLWD